MGFTGGRRGTWEGRRFRGDALRAARYGRRVRDDQWMALIRQLSFREAGQIARQAARFVTARDVEEYLLERLAFLLAKAKIRV